MTNTNEHYIKNFIYDIDLYRELLRKENVTKEEDEYMSYCYHYEEGQMNML